MNLVTHDTKRDSRIGLEEFVAFVAASVVALTLSWGHGGSVRAEQPADASQSTALQVRRFKVSDFGAKGDGITDDTRSIQAAINAAAANPGGGEVLFPRGTYLLNSTSPSTHPWAHYNLQIESGVMLRGEDGAKLLQGPGGRHPVLEDADGVRNSILAFGSDHQIIRFQNPAYNGGFSSLKATRAKSSTVTLKALSEAANFKSGDYVAIYEKTEGDVIPTETGQVVSVDSSTGRLTLKEPLSRSFETPSIANVTHVATTNVGVKNLIIEGAEPLTVTETFGFIAEDCHFINDTSIGGKNVVDFNMNTLNGFRFSGNRFTSIGPGYIVLEMTQRNSRHGVWEDNTIEMMQGGMGEYAADIQFLNNTFTIHPSDRSSVGLMIGGQDIVFRGNQVTCGPITGGEGWGCVLTDCVGPGYHRYVGNITITDNTFHYQGEGNQLTHLVARDTSFTRNTVTVKGSAMGVRGEGPPPQTLKISNNSFKMGTGHAVFLASGGIDGSTVTGNTISGSGKYGIYVASPDKPATGKHVIDDNMVDGYRRSLFIDPALHPEVVLKAPVNSKRSESFSGKAARTGTFKRPLLDVGEIRYELTPSEEADGSVVDLLKKFSAGETGRYVVHGVRATVNRKEGIVVDAIVPAATTSVTEPVAKATPTSTPVPPALSTTDVTTSHKTVGEDRYTVYTYDDGATKAYAVVIPEGTKTVRGLLLNASYLGQDTREEWIQCEYYRQFMHLHDFAFVGAADSDGSHPENAPPLTEDSARGRHFQIFQGFQNSMQTIGTAASHPELAHAPYVSVGFSFGGGTSFNLMCFAPERTIAAVSYASPYNFKRRVTLPPSKALLHVPSISITGDEEHFNAPLPPGVDPAEGPARIDEVFVPYRPQGGEYAWLERQGLGHTYDENRQDVLGMPLLDAAVRARYPKDGDVTQGPIQLIDLDPTTGWIADNTSWRSGLTKIVPAREFTGDVGQSSWLQNEDLAFIYRAYSTYDKPLTITSPGNCWPTMPALEPESNVPIIVDASQFPNWKTMTFYDGAKKLGEVAAGAAPRFTATDLTPGYHVFSILATDGDGNVRTADPKLVIVKPTKVISTTQISDNSETLAASEVTVVTTFPADRGPGYKMIPDTQGAVGPGHVVDFNGLNFVVHDKQTGEVLVKKSQREFWASVEPAGTLIAPNPWDPRFLYDATSGRWIGIIASDGHGHGFLAVSTSSDPTQPWKGIVLPMEKQDLGFKLGVDKNGLYATYASAEPGRDIHTLHDCIAIPKDDLLDPKGPNLANLATFTRLEHDSFPATDLNPEKAPGDPLVILNKEFGNDCGQLYMYKITWQGKSASISKKQVVPLQRKYRSPNTTVEAATAPQPAPGITIRAPRRTIAVAQYGDSVYQCNNAKMDDASPWGIFWCEVRVSDGALLQEGLVTDPDCDYLIPSLAVDKDGTVGIGCTRTSTTEFPSVYVTMRSAEDPKGTMRKPVLAVPGTTYYRVTNPHRFGSQFGNYSSTCIDPTRPGVFWTCQEYADSTTPDQWCTAWAAFRLSE